MRAWQVIRKNTRSQTKICIVGPRNNLCFIFKIEHCHHGTENLFADDGHIVFTAGEDGGLYKGPLPKISINHTLSAGQ